MDALSDRDRLMLDLEREFFVHAGSKEQAIQATLGISATRYYQLLDDLIDHPRALVHDPALVHRLRRRREANMRRHRC